MLEVNIYIFTIKEWLGVNIYIYIQLAHQVNLCTFVHNRYNTGYLCTMYIAQHNNWGGPSPPPIYFWGGTIYIFTAKVGQAVPLYNFLATGPPRASSPPGVHVRGVSSQLSMTYRYLSPKIKE